MTQERPEHLNRSQIIIQGSFYTPEKFVELAGRWIKEFIHDSSYIFLDSSCGYGAFLQLHDLFNENRFIGNDIDEHAVSIAATVYPDISFFCQNALTQVSRDAFGISDNDPLIVVGNPPYNDTTSQSGQKIKRGNDIKIDNDIKSRDLGISFLNSYDKLKADYACILHPLSYLIKKANFKSASKFFNNYQIEKIIVLLDTIRELKLLEIDVFFEKENMHSISKNGELMLTLLAMYAEEESRSASENQKWRIQKMFEQGRPNTGRMLGYCLKDGQLTIIPEEAEIVRMIYEDYLSGMGRLAIANKLNDLHVPTVRGGKEWREGAIYLILRNEKYTGDMILQKTYSEDFRSKKRVINNGERRKYLVEKSHESIISKTVFEQVQEEIARRQSQIKMATHTSKGQFSGLLTCANCGKHFRRRIANASSKYAKPAWLCSTFATRGKRFCNNKQIPEAILISKTKEVLGLCSLDGVNLRDYISEIICHKEQNITFVLTDGDEITVAWSNSSRRNSWTEEMKQAARQKTLERSGL